MRQYIIDVLLELSKHGFSDFIKVEEGKDYYTLDFFKAQQNGALNNVKKATIDKTGKLVFELYDQLDILTILDKISSMSSSDFSKLENDEQLKTLTLEQIIRSRKKVNSEEEAEDDD